MQWPPIGDRKLSVNRSRSGQPPQGAPDADAAKSADSLLVPGAGGGDVKPEPPPEPEGTSKNELLRCKMFSIKNWWYPHRHSTRYNL